MSAAAYCGQKLVITVRRNTRVGRHRRDAGKNTSVVDRSKESEVENEGWHDLNHRKRMVVLYLSTLIIRALDPHRGTRRGRKEGQRGCREGRQYVEVS